MLYWNSDCFLWPSDRAWLAHDVTHQNSCIISQTELTVSWVITLYEIICLSLCLTIYLSVVYIKFKGYSECIYQLSILPSSPKLSWILMIGGTIPFPLWTECFWTWKRCRCLSSSATAAVCFFTDHRIIESDSNASWRAKLFFSPCFGKRFYLHPLPSFVHSCFVCLTRLMSVVS